MRLAIHERFASGQRGGFRCEKPRPSKADHQAQTETLGTSPGRFQQVAGRSVEGMIPSSRGHPTPIGSGSLRGRQ